MKFLDKGRNVKAGILIAGLPGIGLVGKIAVEHLIDELDAMGICKIYSFSFPAQVELNNQGVIKLIEVQVYFWDAKSPNKNIILLTGDTQPQDSQGSYELAETILELASKYGVREVYTMAAYMTGRHPEQPRVFVAATDLNILNRILKRAEAIPMTGGSITGLNGLLIGLAKLYNMSGACLLGETSGYVADPGAAKAVLETLAKVLGLQIDTAELEEKAKETSRFIRDLERAREVERKGREEKPSYIG